MNILYINHYAGSIHHGMEYRPYYLALEWIKLGHSVTIVASNYSHLRSTNVSMTNRQKYLYQNIDGIRYIWCKTSYYKHNGLARVYNIWLFLYRLKRLWKNQIVDWMPDVVIASSTYPFDVAIAKTIAHKCKAKLIYEVHDLWPLTLIELGGMKAFHPFIWWMQRAENFAYKHADQVISLLPNAVTYMQLHGLDVRKFNYIPNGISPDSGYNNHQPLPIEHMHRIKHMREHYTCLIGYAGSIGNANALDDLIVAAENLNNIGLVIVGDGPCVSSLLHELQVKQIKNVFFLPRINKVQIPDFLASMDGLYIGWKNLPIYNFGVSPNKLFDYMLAAKPIIHATVNLNDIVRQAQCGITVAAENVSQIKQALVELSQMSPTQRNAMGQNGYNYVIQKHNYVHLAQDFINICQN